MAHCTRHKIIFSFHSRVYCSLYNFMRFLRRLTASVHAFARSVFSEINSHSKLDYVIVLIFQFHVLFVFRYTHFLVSALQRVRPLFICVRGLRTFNESSSQRRTRELVTRRNCPIIDASGRIGAGNGVNANSTRGCISNAGDGQSCRNYPRRRRCSTAARSAGSWA